MIVLSLAIFFAEFYFQLSLMEKDLFISAVFLSKICVLHSSNQVL